MTAPTRTTRRKKVEWEEEPVCPKCDSVLFEPDDLPESLDEDGDTMSITCEDCGTHCKVTLGVAVEFLTEEE